MANRGVVVGVKTNAGIVPAVVEAARDEDGAVVADGSNFTGVTEVDALLLGVDAGRRTAAWSATEAGAEVGEAFEYGSS